MHRSNARCLTGATKAGGRASAACIVTRNGHLPGSSQCCGLCCNLINALGRELSAQYKQCDNENQQPSQCNCDTLRAAKARGLVGVAHFRTLCRNYKMATARIKGFHDAPSDETK